MAAVIVACAATLGRRPDVTLTSVGDMSRALTPFLGIGLGRFVFGAGVLGAGLVAAIVCSLGFAWGLGEVTGHRHTLEQHPLRARWFYGAYAIIVVGATITVALWPDLIALNIGVQVMNAFMLPVLLGVLIALSVMALPPAHRLRGPYLWLVLTVCALTAATGVFGGVSGLGLLG
jgi:Mn2+/Fe2+ NRAMP family transporter